MIRNLERNVKNLHNKHDFTDEAFMNKPKVEPTLRQRKILANLIAMVNKMALKR